MVSDGAPNEPEVFMLEDPLQDTAAVEGPTPQPDESDQRSFGLIRRG